MAAAGMPLPGAEGGLGALLSSLSSNASDACIAVSSTDEPVDLILATEDAPATAGAALRMSDPHEIELTLMGRLLLDPESLLVMSNDNGYQY
jgi:hypothetical protein